MGLEIPSVLGPETDPEKDFPVGEGPENRRRFFGARGEGIEPDDFAAEKLVEYPKIPFGRKKMYSGWINLLDNEPLPPLVSEQ